MTRVVANNAPFQLLITPRDAAGQPITNLGNIAKERWVVTDGTYNFTVNSSDTQFNTPYVQYLLSITPNVLSLGNKNLTIKLDNATVATAPSPLQYDFRPGYRGKFTLTNAMLAWDGSLPANPTYELYDYSDNGLRGSRFDATSFSRTVFTDTTQYKIGPNGALITLGRHTLGGTGAGGTIAGASAEVFGSGRDSICNGKFTAPPAKTVQCVFWRGGDADSESTNLFIYGIRDGANSAGLALWLDEIALDGTTTVSLRSNSSTLISYTISSPNNIFMKGNELICLSFRINGDGTVSFFVNKTLAGSASWTPVNEANSAPIVWALTGDRYSSTYGDGGSAGTVRFAMLDCAMYSDVKSDSFIQSNAAAWGF